MKHNIDFQNSNHIFLFPLAHPIPISNVHFTKPFSNSCKESLWLIILNINDFIWNKCWRKTAVSVFPQSLKVARTVPQRTIKSEYNSANPRDFSLPYIVQEAHLHPVVEGTEIGIKPSQCCALKVENCSPLASVHTHSNFWHTVFLIVSNWPWEHWLGWLYFLKSGLLKYNLQTVKPTLS